MMQDIRMEQPKLASTYRPSWVRNFQDDVQQPREEGMEAWSAEIPRVPDGKFADFKDIYQRASAHTLNDFGKGGLPFETQDRVIPDGLDPVASNRPMTKRYNAYALGDDLTAYMADHGRVHTHVLLPRPVPYHSPSLAVFLFCLQNTIDLIPCHPHR